MSFSYVYLKWNKVYLCFKRVNSSLNVIIPLKKPHGRLAAAMQFENGTPLKLKIGETGNPLISIF